MERIAKEGNLISTDVFSTYRDGRAIGTEEYLLLDTQTWEYEGIKIKQPGAFKYYASDFINLSNNHKHHNVCHVWGG